MGSEEQTNVTSDALLDEIHSRLIKEYIPVFAYLAVQMVLGITGNILTFIFYAFKTKQTTTTLFIASLAVMDLSVSVLAATHIVVLGINVYFDNSTGCRVYYFATHVSVVSSTTMLFIISVDRFLKVCRPLEDQITLHQTKIVILCNVILAVIISAPHLVLMNTVAVTMTSNNGTHVTGHYCAHSDNPVLRPFQMLLYAVDLIIVAAVSLSFIVLYALILRTIIIHKRKNESLKLNRPRSVATDSDTGGTEYNTFTDQSAAGRHMSDRDNQRHIGSAETKVTYSMLVITVGYIVSFAPYFVVIVAIRGVSESELTYGPQLMYRSYMINSVINPIVYGVFNDKFRKFLCTVFFPCKNKTM